MPIKRLDPPKRKSSKFEEFTVVVPPKRLGPPIVKTPYKLWTWMNGREYLDPYIYLFS